MWFINFIEKKKKKILKIYSSNLPLGNTGGCQTRSSWVGEGEVTLGGKMPSGALSMVSAEVALLTLHPPSVHAYRQIVNNTPHVNTNIQKLWIEHYKWKSFCCFLLIFIHTNSV